MDLYINKKIIKKISIIIFLCLIFTGHIFHAEDILYTEGDFQFYKINGAITIVKYIGEDSEVHVPYNFSSYEVKGIESGAFVGTSATTVYLYDNIQHLDQDAFDPSTQIVFIDVNGNNVDNPTNVYDVNHDTEDSTDDVENEDEFEDDIIDISDEMEEVEDEESQEAIRKKREYKEERNGVWHLFDGSLFSSDFEVNITGYIIIGASLIVLVVIFIYIFKNK